MSIKKRRTKRKPQSIVSENPLDRTGNILASGHGTEENAEEFFSAFHADMLRRMQDISRKADAGESWDFMDGCYKQAMELYALAATLYERHPDHVIMTDSSFDSLARWLNKNYDKLDPDFRSWYAITAIDLRAATGMNICIQPPISNMLEILLNEKEDTTNGTKDEAAIPPQKIKRRRRRGARERRTPSKNNREASTIRKRVVRRKTKR